ncbi:MAG: hypothetical protein ACYC0V_05855 [Armatimonadota bacterium]
MKKLRIIVMSLVVIAATVAVLFSYTYSNSEADLSKAVLKPGVYLTKWIIPDEDVYYSYSLPGYSQPLKTLPVSIKKPNRRLNNPIFGFIVIAKNQDSAKTSTRYYIIDESNGKNTGYDTLYFDANMNGDFTDEKQTNGKQDELFGKPGSNFEKIIFNYVADIPMNKLFAEVSNPNPVRLKMSFNIIRKPFRVYCDIYPRGCYTGYVDTNVGRLPFQMLDMDLNGRYDDLVTYKLNNYPQSDWVIMGTNRSDKYLNTSEMAKIISKQPVSQVNLFNDRLYRLKPDASGKSLSVSDYTGPSGKFKVSIGKIGSVAGGRFGYRLPLLAGESSAFELPEDGHAVTLPVGRYHIYSFIIEQRLNGLPRSQIQYMSHRDAVVIMNHESTMKVSGNIQFLIEPKKKQCTLQRGIANKTLLILRMPEGEVIHVNTRGESVVPTFKLKDASGKVVYKGDTNLEGYYKDFKVLPKSVKPGKYTAEATFDLGPFGGKLVAKRQVMVK